MNTFKYDLLDVSLIDLDIENPARRIAPGMSRPPVAGLTSKGLPMIHCSNQLRPIRG